MSDQPIKIEQMPYEIDLDSVSNEPLNLGVTLRQPDPMDDDVLIPFDFTGWTVTAIVFKPNRPQQVYDSFDVDVDDPDPGSLALSITGAQTLVLGAGKFIVLVQMQGPSDDEPVSYVQYNWTLHMIGWSGGG